MKMFLTGATVAVILIIGGWIALDYAGTLKAVEYAPPSVHLPRNI